MARCLPRSLARLKDLVLQPHGHQLDLHRCIIYSLGCCIVHSAGSVLGCLPDLLGAFLYRVAHPDGPLGPPACQLLRGIPRNTRVQIRSGQEGKAAAPQGASAASQVGDQVVQ